MTRSTIAKFLSSVLLTGSLLCGSVLPSSALEAPNFRVINGGQTRAIEVNVSPSASDDWGDNLLAIDLDPGHYVYALKNYTIGSCVQDLRVVYEDEHVEYLYNINICRNDITLHY
jgi:hypothetical protein